MAKKKPGPAWQPLMTGHRGAPPKKLTTVMVPPTEWTRAIVRANNDTVYVYDNPEGWLSFFPWHGRCDVHSVYWDWCDDEQKRRRKLFFDWLRGPIEPEVEREAPRAARFFDKKIGKEIVVMTSGPAPPVNSVNRKDQVFLGWAEGPLGQSRKIMSRRRPWRDPDPMTGPSMDDVPFMWELAEAIFPGLRLPTLYKRGKTAKEAKAIIEAVTKAHKDHPKDSVEAACRKAGTSKTVFYRAGGRSWRTRHPEK
jgi:hypothetical protein